MEPLALCFSGGIGSGKTTLAVAVSVQFGLRHASFGQFVRAAAKRRGLPSSREHLQQLGENLIEELGWEDFCRGVLAEAGWSAKQPIAVEGVRHTLALDTITRVVAPMAVRLVYLDVAPTIRELRLRSERPDDAADLARADAHPNERDVHVELRARADLVLDATRDHEFLVAEVSNRYLAGAPRQSHGLGPGSKPQP